MRAVSVTASLLFVMTPIYTPGGDVVPDRSGVTPQSWKRGHGRARRAAGARRSSRSASRRVPTSSGRSRTWRSGPEPRSRSSRTYAAAHAASGAPALPRTRGIPLVAAQLDLESVVEASDDVFEQVEDEAGRTMLDRPLTPEERRRRTRRTGSGCRRAARAGSSRSCRVRSRGRGLGAARARGRRSTPSVRSSGFA